jgi:hypothetical protein
MDPEHSLRAQPGSSGGLPFSMKETGKPPEIQVR